MLSETFEPVSVSSTKGPTNIIPDQCKYIFDYRTLPGRCDAEQVIQGIIEKAHVNADLNILFTSPGYVLECEAPIISITKKHAKMQFKKAPPVIIALGKADAEYFYRKGMDTIMFGPGVNHQAHEPNEYCLISSLEAWVETTKLIISDYFKENNDTHNK